MASARSKLGAQGERIAAARLEAQGMTIAARNYRTRFGEIDLVARDGEETVFVEVRTRRGENYGTPEESLTRRKQARLTLAAQEYLQERGGADRPWRIDFAAVALRAEGPAEIRIVTSAVEEA